MQSQSVRQPIFAGSFYPEDPVELRSAIEGYIAEAKVAVGKCALSGLICPHASFQFSGPIAGYSYHVLKDCLADSHDPLKIIIIGPSHQEWLDGIALPESSTWKTPLGDVAIWALARDFLVEEKGCIANEKAHTLEHSLETQMPFLQVALEGKTFEVLPMLVSEVNISKTADILEKYIDKNTIVIASSDLSHYLPYDEAEVTDKHTIEAIINSDPKQMRLEGDACGMIPILILMELAKRNEWKAVLTDYRNSGDTGGAKSMVVGYTSIYFSRS